MNDVANPMNRESHFEFGKNRASYVRLVTDAHVQEAACALQRLVQVAMALSKRRSFRSYVAAYGQRRGFRRVRAFTRADIQL